MSLPNIPNLQLVIKRMSDDDLENAVNWHEEHLHLLYQEQQHRLEDAIDADRMELSRDSFGTVQ